MLNGEIRETVEELDTPALANWFQELTEEKRSLKGHIAWDVKKQERNAEIKRYLAILAQELNNRQLTMKGF